MEWRDRAILLSARKHGESSCIAQVLTHHHGRYAGLVRGGAGKRLRGALQPGNELECGWRARLADQLGTLSVELAEAHAARVLDSRGRLTAMSAACAVTEAMLPEREPHPPVFDGLVALLAMLETSAAWPAAYVRWEVELLREVGFGLDLSRCAATGATDDLLWVSPRSGRAVCAAAGAPYRDRLLALPPFLVGGGPPDDAAVAAGLRLTGYFLARQHPDLPAARDRLMDRFSRKTAGSCGTETQ